jgi:hypothetical protein
MGWNENYFDNWDRKTLGFSNRPEFYHLYSQIFKGFKNDTVDFGTNQLKCLKELERNRKFIIEKGRQVGESTIISLYLIVKAFLNPSSTTLIYSNSDYMNRYLLELMTRFYYNMDYIEPNEFTMISSNNQIKLKNNSKIINKGINIIPSLINIDTIYIENNDNHDNIMNFIDVAIPMLKPDGQIIITTRLGDNLSTFLDWPNIRLLYRDNPITTQESYDRLLSYGNDPNFGYIV